MKRIGAALAAAAVATLGTLAFAAPAMAATDPAPQVGTVTGSPDNGCPPWARDTFTRTTTITESGTAGTYDIRQDIDGTWVSEANPDIKGTISGFVEYTVTGTLLGDLDAVDDDVDLTALDCKQNAPADSQDKAGNWALRYFEQGASATPISNWEYTYDTACEDPYTENDNSEAMSDKVFTKVCVAPAPVETAGEWSCDEEWTYAHGTVTYPATEHLKYRLDGEDATDTASFTREEKHAVEFVVDDGYALEGDGSKVWEAVAPPETPEDSCPPVSTETTTTSAAPTLPVTGAGLTTLLVVGGALIVAGGAALILARRRRA